MADAVVSVVLEQAISFLAQKIEENVRLVVGTKKEVKKLSKKLETIQAVLNDAEKKEIKNESVRVWLENLKDVSYEAEDVLDEWNTAILKAQNENTTSGPASNKVCSCFPSPSFRFSQICLRHNISSKIKDIKETLDEIVNEKKQFDFIPSGRVEEPDRPKTTSFIDVTKVCGRKMDKDTIINKLLCESSQGEKGLHIISIVGMGGIGKTTLARLAYNDDEVKAHFDKRIWVCVSDPFDQMSIARSILEALTEGPVQNFLELEIPLQQIQDLIKEKKLLVVLDDVWTEDSEKWEPLKLSLKCGRRESRILVTTRNEKVAKVMETLPSDVLFLNKLSEEECWLLLKQIAFYGKDREECEKLEDIGKKIANKCKGLPLAAKTLGGLLQFKETKQDWEDVLNSEIWEWEEVERDLLAPLLLSYYDLPSPVKRCFSYCAIFPKDYVIEKALLIKLWMAQGFLSSKRSIDMETKGDEYFTNLVMRSFFQDFEKDSEGSIINCKMHDIVHDFAQFLMKNECFNIVKNDGERELGMESPCSKARHSPIILDSIPSSLYKAKSLRTLILDLRFIEDATLPSISFDYFMCLGVLVITRFDGKELPSTIGKLVHLRYLEISSNRKLEELPETVCDLYNLQTLDLRSSVQLRKLPQRMRKLVNLRHLVLGRPWSTYLVGMPKGIGEMRPLRTLDMFVVCDNNGEEAGCCKIAELKNLNHLQGHLSLYGLANVTNVDDAVEANLHEKGRLCSLSIINREKEVVKEGVIEALHPHTCLERLHFSLEKGATHVFPSWTFLLPNLTILELHRCSEFEHLPPLGKLPSLERLDVRNMWKVKSVGDEFLGIGMNDDDGTTQVIKLFPKLKHLSFTRLTAWVKWVDPTKKRQGEEDPSIIIMPNLVSLEVKTCINLKDQLPHYILKTPLRELIIQRCGSLSERYRKVNGEDWNKISHIPTVHVLR